MTDRIKGYLVTLEGEFRDDDAEYIQKAIEMIRGVSKVKPYVKSAEDYMMYEKGYNDCKQEILKLLYALKK